MKLNRSRINGTTDIRQRRQFLKALRRLYQAAAGHRNFDEFRVELGGEEAGDHVRDLRN